MPALAGYFCSLWKVESITLVVFLLLLGSGGQVTVTEPRYFCYMTEYLATYNLSPIFHCNGPLQLPVSDILNVTK
jgi:hypothetical protein